MVTASFPIHPRALRFLRLRAAVLFGPDSGAMFETDAAVVRIGSAPDNHLVLTDPSVSRHHLEIQREHGRYLIVDLGSKNGTYLESTRITEGTLRGPARIQVGSTTLLVQPRRAPAPPVVERSRLAGIVGRSKPMQELYALIEKCSPTDLPILILGETGSGKDATARAIHTRSLRKSESFFTVDGTGIPP